MESPDGRNEVTVGVRDGRLYDSVQREGQPVLLSRITLTLAAGGGQAIRIRPAR